MKFRSIEITLTEKGKISYIINGAIKVYEVKDSEFTHAAMEWLKERFSTRLKVLEAMFKSSRHNTQLFKWNIVTRFFACKCGALDNVLDIDIDGNLTAEFMLCPHRFFCKDLTCEAMPDLKLTDIEKEIVYSLFEGKSIAETANYLDRDIEAVRSSIGRACKRFGLTKNSSKLVAYCNKNNLI